MSRGALTTYAKVTPILTRMPGLFLVTPSGPRRPFDVTLKDGDMTWRLFGPEQLSVGDLEVLLCLIALAGAQSNESYQATKRQKSRDPVTRLRQMLGRAIEVRTTYSELARELKRSAGGATWPFIKDSIDRMSRVWVTVRSHCGSEVDKAPLLRPMQDDENRGAAAFTLCPVLAAGVLGGPGEYIQVSMEDFRSLQDRSGVSRALYFRLHGRYADQYHLIRIDRLVELAYGSSVPADSLRKYRARVKGAAKAIDGLAQWKLQSHKGGEFTFRHSSKKVVTTAESGAPTNP